MSKPALEFLAQLEQQHRKADRLTAKERAITESLGAMREVIKLGRRDRSTRNFNPPGRSGDAAIAEAQDLIGRRMRASYWNNSLIKRATHVLRDIIVGTGINTYADPIDHSFSWNLKGRPDADLLRALDYALASDELFEQWAEDPKQVDVAGNLSWFDIQRMIISEDVLVGDVLLLECRRRQNKTIPLCYQLIEREQIDCTKDRPRGNGLNGVINGFEIDEFGREVGCYIYDAHPHDDNAAFSMATGESSFVPKSRYHHIYHATRPSQRAGVTWLHTLGQPTIDRDTFIDTEIRAAVKAAQHVLVHTLQDYVPDLGLDSLGDDDPLGHPEVHLGSDLLAAQVGPDEKVEIVESDRPNPDANNFFDILDHDIAVGADLSYPTMTGRFTKTNYQGFRGALQLEDSQMRPIQNWLGRRLVLPVRRRFNAVAVGLGKVDHVTATEFRREETRLQRFDCIGPGRTLLDVDKETEGDITQLRGALQTLKIACARRGLHWIRVLRQKALEQRVAEILGVPVDHSKGQGGERKPQQSAESDTDED